MLCHIVTLQPAAYETKPTRPIVHIVYRLYTQIHHVFVYSNTRTLHYIKPATPFTMAYIK